MPEQIPCGPDVDEHVQWIRPFLDAGFTHVAVVQIGGDHQEDFLRWSEKELLPPALALTSAGRPIAGRRPREPPMLGTR